jgi:hypothetical protein
LFTVNSYMFRLLPQSVRQAKLLKIYIEEKYWCTGIESEKFCQLRTQNFSSGRAEGDAQYIGYIIYVSF